MNTTTTATLLEQIAQIQRMEPGKLCVMRQGSEGPYYNLQYRQDGKTVSCYVPRDQAEAVAEHTANHRKFRELVDAYADQLFERTRRERMEGAKKKTSPKPLHGRRTPKSKS